MSEEHRESRHGEEEILTLVREIHQRQNEVVIPTMENIKATLYGNGKPGLCRDMADLKIDVAKIDVVDKRVDRIDNRFWYLIGGLVLGSPVLGFIIYIITK